MREAEHEHRDDDDESKEVGLDASMDDEHERGGRLESSMKVFVLFCFVVNVINGLNFEKQKAKINSTLGLKTSKSNVLVLEND